LARGLALKLPVEVASIELSDDLQELRVDGRVFKPSTRLVGDLKPVLASSVDESLQSEPAYFMFRSVSRAVDEQLFKCLCLRYDITVIPPRVLGEEFVKTFGHYHPTPYGDLSYPEVYEVLVGEAHYILQREERGAIKDIVVVRAREGDKVLIPPNYGHVTVNPSSKILVMANLVSSTFKSIYEPYKAKRGAALYELADGRLLANEEYGETPRYREEKPLRNLPGAAGGDLYTSFLKNPLAYRFLNNPLLTPRVW